MPWPPAPPRNELGGMTTVADRTDPVPLSAARDAAKAIEGVAVCTPVVDLPALAARLGVPVGLKCEHLQPIGAFKIRGAYNAISRIAARGGAPGVVTASS